MRFYSLSFYTFNVSVTCQCVEVPAVQKCSLQLNRPGNPMPIVVSFGEGGKCGGTCTPCGTVQPHAAAPRLVSDERRVAADFPRNRHKTAQRQRCAQACPGVIVSVRRQLFTSKDSDSGRPITLQSSECACLFSQWICDHIRACLFSCVYDSRYCSRLCGWRFVCDMIYRIFSPTRARTQPRV